MNSKIDSVKVVRYVQYGVSFRCMWPVAYGPGEPEQWAGEEARRIFAQEQAAGNVRIEGPEGTVRMERSVMSTVVDSVRWDTATGAQPGYAWYACTVTLTVEKEG